MRFVFIVVAIAISMSHAQNIKHLTEISINEELPIGSIVSSLTDKIPNLDQSQEYDLVTPLSPDLDLFSVDHERRALTIKNRIDFEKLCSIKHRCIISVSIAVANQNTIDVYMLPVHIINIDDNHVKFHINRTVIEIDENDNEWSTRFYPLPSASDADGDSISYSLFLYNWTATTGLFQLEKNTTGSLSLRPLRAFDREQQHLYALRLLAHSGTVRQQGKDDASMDVIVVIKDVNDNVPQCEFNRTEFLLDNLLSIPTLLINATDRDEGDNGKLDYILMNPSSAFTLDQNNGQLKFDYTKWIQSNESTLIINVTDHGKPHRLSTQCFVDLKFTFVFDIKFQTKHGNDMSITIRDPLSSLGRLTITDKLQHTTCLDCHVRLTSSVPDILTRNPVTDDLYLNLSSTILLRILTNPSLINEDLPLTVNIDTWRPENPAISSSRQISLLFHFDKDYLLTRSNLFFIKVNEDVQLEKSIARMNRCANQSRELLLIDESQTFEMDSERNIIVKKYLNIAQRQSYELLVKQKGDNQTNEENSCSIQIRIVVTDPYASDSYFPQSFYILSAHSILQFALPALPMHVKYVSSVPDLIAVDSRNGSITIRSSSLVDKHYFDFQIQAIDSRTPSFNSAVPVRIFFGINRQAPRSATEPAVHTIQVPSSGYLFRVQAYDPDLLPNDHRKILPPPIEYQIDTLTSSPMHLEIERYSGRVFIKRPHRSALPSFLNLTVLMTDFGQPRRLTSRQMFTFDLTWTNENSIPIATSMTTSFVLIGASLFVIIIIISAIILIFNCCCCCSTTHERVPQKRSSTSSHQTSWKNISPTTPDTRLIDNEYVTTTSLPRTTTREQRIYPTLSYVHHQPPRLLSHSSLDKINLPPPPAAYAKHVDHLSMTDINKYLERFEKIYNDSSSQQHLHGSVV